MYPIKAFKVPVDDRPLEFWSRDAALKSYAAAMKEKLDVPVFEDLDVAWKWQLVCQDVVEKLKSEGKIYYPSVRDLWIKEEHAARIAAQQDAAHTETQDAVDGDAKRAEGYKAGWDSGHENGRTEGYNLGKVEGRAEALSQAMVQINQLACKQPANVTASSSATQLAQPINTPDVGKSAATDPTHFRAFGGNPGPLAGSSRNNGEASTRDSSKRDGSVLPAAPQPAVEPAFPKHFAGHIFQDYSTDLSRSNPSVESPKPKPSQSTATDAPAESPFAKLTPTASWTSKKPVGKIAPATPSSAHPLFGTSTPFGRSVLSGSPATQSTASTAGHVKRETQPGTKNTLNPTLSGVMGLFKGGPAPSDGPSTPVADPLDKKSPQSGPVSRKRRFEGGADCDDPPSVKRFRS
ncbi:hypothetical protein IWZ00DRAFT_532726 [Phyllosticta capitalensis]|uniref:uncharacterized protein n=1 Tax=Phyllosticta capitalensis TaxID=121624 RepID=UPI0031306AD5